MPTILFIDSQWLSQYFAYGQWLANLGMLAAFIWIYQQSGKRLQKLMKYGTLISLCGELLFSLVLGMYEYRLENVPLYVPLGHAILYAAVYYWVRDPLVQRYKALNNQLCFAVAIGYGLLWWWWQNDVYGLLCLIVMLFGLWRLKEARFFLLSMYLLVAYLEQLGTRLGCWYWPEIAFGQFAWLPSGNPPSAIGVFYLVFDLTNAWFYLQRNRKLKQRLALKKQALTAA